MHVFRVTYLNLTRMRRNFKGNLSAQFTSTIFFIYSLSDVVFDRSSLVLRKYEYDGEIAECETRGSRIFGLFEISVSLAHRSRGGASREIERRTRIGALVAHACAAPPRNVSTRSWTFKRLHEEIVTLSRAFAWCNCMFPYRQYYSLVFDHRGLIDLPRVSRKWYSTFRGKLWNVNIDVTYGFSWS